MKLAVSALTVRQLAIVSFLIFCLAACDRRQTPNRQISKTAQKPKTSGHIMIGSTLGSKLIHYVRPQYPAWARRKHIEGTVEIRATVGKDGRVRELIFVSGPKELAPYAEAAVHKWRYEPTTLNGTPLEVKTDIMVPFFLNR